MKYLFLILLLSGCYSEQENAAYLSQARHELSAYTSIRQITNVYCRPVTYQTATPRLWCEGTINGTGTWYNFYCEHNGCRSN